MSITIINLEILSAEILLCIMIVFLTTLNVALEKKHNGSFNQVNFNINLYLLISILCTLIALNGNYYTITNTIHSFQCGYDCTFIKILIYTFSGLILLSSKNYLFNTNIVKYEYIIITMISVCGLSLLTSSISLLSFYLSIELVSLSFYVLAAFHRNSEYSTESAYKYFIMGAVASSFMLLSFSYFYGLTGTINFIEIEELWYTISITDFDYNLIFIVTFLFVSSLLFKVGLVPYHMWLPDVYDGSPSSSTAFFAIVPKLVIFYWLIKIIHIYLFSSSITLYYWNLLFAIASIIIGSLGAIFQSKIKRLMAYGAIAHSGYIFLGILTVTPEGAGYSMLYMFVYMIMSLIFFSILMELREQESNRLLKYTRELILVAKQHPSLAIILTVLLFSMAGIPPLAGFFTKYYILYNMVSVERIPYLIIIVTASLIGSFYYIYLIRKIYFEKIDVNVTIVSISTINSYIISFGSLFLILFFIKSDLIVNEFQNLIYYIL